MNPALVRVMASTRKVAEKTRFGLDDASTVFIGVYRNEDKILSSRVPLGGGTEYAFLGGGGDVVAQDPEKDATPIVPYSRGGTFSLKLQDAKSKGAALCLAAAVQRKPK